MLASGHVDTHRAEPAAVAASTHLAGQPLHNRKLILERFERCHRFWQSNIGQRFVASVFASEWFGRDSFRNDAAGFHDEDETLRQRAGVSGGLKLNLVQERRE